LDNLVLPHDETSLLQPFINVGISRAAIMTTTRKLKDEVLKRRGEVSYTTC
jgi:hypothetical protein